MTRDELMEYLDTVLSQASHGPPEGPRPAGTFLCGAPPGPLSGMRLVAPDGAVFYLAVIDAADLNGGEG